VSIAKVEKLNLNPFFLKHGSECSFKILISIFDVDFLLCYKKRGISGARLKQRIANCFGFPEKRLILSDD